MIDVTPNVPDVVAEVREIFERYEQALIDKNVDVLDATFWDSPHTIRYALEPQQRVTCANTASQRPWRRAQPSV
jgi:hypothetical protein